VITNPPFHTGKKSEPVLGGAFVATAYKLLKPKGALYLVGNSHLPYYKIMSAFFGEVEMLAREQGFTVLRGRK
jgi:16S rRNA (guanine1207-N2)-methyltransferase